MVSPMKLALSISEFCARASIGRTTAFSEIRAGQLIARKRGRSTIILVADAEMYLQVAPPSRESHSRTPSTRYRVRQNNLYFLNFKEK